MTYQCCIHAYVHVHNIIHIIHVYMHVHVHICIYVTCQAKTRLMRPIYDFYVIISSDRELLFLSNATYLIKIGCSVEKLSRGKAP